MIRNLCSRLPRSHSSLPAALLMPARPAHRAFTASGRRGAAPDAAAAAAAAVKPRATGGTVTSKRKRHYYLAALIGGPLVFVGYLAYKYKSVQEAIDDIRSVFEGVKEAGIADPTIEELQRVLGPPPPEFYINVLMAMEDTIVKREWDRRYGWRYEVRPGVKEMMASLLEAGSMVTLWSDASGTVATETAGKLSMDFGMALPVTQLHLGPEHCFSRPTEPTRKEKHIGHFNRDMKTVLLVDSDPLSGELNPRNTVVVRSMKSLEDERAAAEKEGRPVPVDSTAKAISLLVARIRSDAQATGEVNVPQTLHSLRSEATAAGFASDTGGIVEYMQKETQRAAALDRERKETGLGGLLRRTITSSRVLNGKPSVVEVAASRPFRDPTYDLGEDSMLTQRVREASRKLQLDRGQ